MPESHDPEAVHGHPVEFGQPYSRHAAAAVPTFPDLDQYQSHPLHFIFFGREGLRAGWGLLLAFVLFWAALAGIRYFAHTVSIRVHGNRSTAAARSVANQPRTTDDTTGMSATSAFAMEGETIFSVTVATLVLARIEHRKLSTYGFAHQSRLRNFCAGLVCGLALLSLLVALLRAAGWLVFDERLLFGGSILRYSLIWFAGFLLVGVAEEFINRAYAQFTLTRGLSAIYRLLFGESNANSLGFWTATILLSFLFGFGHRTNPGESPLGLLSAGLAGFLFSFSLWRTGSLWWAIGFHASWDWAQSFLYGVPDSGLMAQGHLFATHPVGQPFLSGGTTGPEGSLLLLPVAAVGAIVVFLTLPRTHFGYIPASASKPSLD